LFREVWRDNLTFAQHQHALHPTFFRFMSDLVVSASRIASTAAARSSHGKELLQSTAELALAFTFETLARVKRDDSKCLTDIIAALCRLLNHTAVVSPVPGSTSVCCAFLSKQLTLLSTNPLRAPLAELLLRTGDSETRGSISRLVVACIRAVVRAAGDDAGYSEGDDCGEEEGTDTVHATQQSECRRVWTAFVDAYLGLLHEAVRRNWVRFREYFEGLSALVELPAVAARLRAQSAIAQLGDFVMGGGIHNSITMGSTQYPADFSAVIDCIASLVDAFPRAPAEDVAAAAEAGGNEAIILDLHGISDEDAAMLSNPAFLRKAINNPSPDALASVGRIVCRCSYGSQSYSAIAAEELLRALQCAICDYRIKQSLALFGGSLSCLNAEVTRRKFVVPLWAVIRGWLAISGDGFGIVRARLFVGPTLPDFNEMFPSDADPSRAASKTAAPSETVSRRREPLAEFSSVDVTQGSFAAARSRRNRNRSEATMPTICAGSTIGGANADVGAAIDGQGEDQGQRSATATVAVPPIFRHRGQRFGIIRFLPFLEKFAAMRPMMGYQQNRITVDQGNVGDVYNAVRHFVALAMGTSVLSDSAADSDGGMAQARVATALGSLWPGFGVKNRALIEALSSASPSAAYVANNDRAIETALKKIDTEMRLCSAADEEAQINMMREELRLSSSALEAVLPSSATTTGWGAAVGTRDLRNAGFNVAACQWEEHPGVNPTLYSGIGWMCDVLRWFATGEPMRMKSECATTSALTSEAKLTALDSLRLAEELIAEVDGSAMHRLNKVHRGDRTSWWYRRWHERFEFESAAFSALMMDHGTLIGDAQPDKHVGIWDIELGA
jgi:hypothetical protein